MMTEEDQLNMAIERLVGNRRAILAVLRGGGCWNLASQVEHDLRAMAALGLGTDQALHELPVWKIRRMSMIKGMKECPDCGGNMILWPNGKWVCENCERKPEEEEPMNDNPKSRYEELVEILIVLAEIVCALSDDDNFSGGWQAAEVVQKLKSLRVGHQADEDWI